MSPLRHIKVVELMADYSLTYNPLFFGQFALIQDRAAHWSTFKHGRQQVPIQHYYVGSMVSGPRGLLVPDPTTDKRAYLNAVAELCAEGQPVFALSHFIHKDAGALACLSDLKKQFQNFHLIVMLHCTIDEFLRPPSAGRTSHDQRAERQAKRAVEFKRSLKILAGEKGANCFVAVSEPTRRSYIRNRHATSIPADRIVTIPNGVNPRHYRPCAKDVQGRRRTALGLAEGLILGCTNRWTQAKGKDILEALLDRLEQASSQFNATFLFPSIIHDQMFGFLESLPDRYPRMYQAGRLRAFVDVSRLKRSVFPCDMDALEKSYWSEIEAQPRTVRRVLDKIFLGFLGYPVHTLLDRYLRPSVAEAFGLGIVEAYLCGVPVLASDRGSCRALVLPEHQVHLEPVIQLGRDYQNHTHPGYRAAVGRAADALFTLLRTLSAWQVPARELRSRMILGGYTTSQMIKRYNRLLSGILSTSGEDEAPI